MRGLMKWIGVAVFAVVTCLGLSAPAMAVVTLNDIGINIEEHVAAMGTALGAGLLAVLAIGVFLLVLRKVWSYCRSFVR